MTDEEFILAHLSYDALSGVVTRKGRELKARHTSGYSMAYVNGRAMLCHRIAWFLHHGTWPSGHIDHANGNVADNRIGNLRECTVTQNMGNTKLSTRNRSGFKGVHWNSQNKNWQAQIRVAGKSTYIGSFATREAAHAAYMAKAREVFGEFARAA